MPINDDLEAIFKKIRKEKQLKSKYVFTDDKSRLLKSIKRSFNSAVDDAKIEDFRFHDLRHTFCSNLLLAGSDLKDVKEMIGHRDIKMTDRYSHITMNHKRLQQAKLAGHYAKSK